MNIEQETWLTTGEAAKMASRDRRTIRRWAQTGVLTSRVSPGGWRQIALSSLLEAQRPPNQSRSTRGPIPPPPDTIGHWAQITNDWYGWRPTRAMSSGELEGLLIASRDVAAAMATMETTVLEELRRRDSLEPDPAF